MKFEYKGNKGGLKPLIMLLPFAAGSVNTVEQGQACVLDTGVFTPLATDIAKVGTVVIAMKDITALHAAGCYPALVPQPGDFFKAPLAAASAAARGASVYVTTAGQQLAVAGTYPIGNVIDHAGFPKQQGNPDVGDVADRGTTVLSVGEVDVTIKAAASYLAALQT